jgi:hypothetical protein
MSNGNRWTSSQGYNASDEEATRAVSRDDLTNATQSPNHRDKTVVVDQDQYPHQEKTKAIDFNEFQEATKAIDTNDEKTRALNKDLFDFKQLNTTYPSQQSSHAQSYPSPSPAPIHPTAVQSDTLLTVPPVEADYRASQPSSYPSPNPRDVQTPNVHSIPSSSNSSTMPAYPNPPHPMQLELGSSQTHPVPTMPLDSNTERQPQTTYPNPVSRFGHDDGLNRTQPRAKFTDRSELTQAHLNSQALQDVILNHRYTEGGDSKANQPLRQSRKKRANLIILGACGVGFLIIAIALTATLLGNTTQLSQVIEKYNVSPPELEGMYAIPLTETSTSQVPAQSPQKIRLIFNKDVLSLAHQPTDYSIEINLSPQDLMPRPHPLRLNGAFLNTVSTNIAPTWPAKNVTEGLVVTDQSQNLGTILDLLTTLSVISQRKGYTLNQFAVLIEQKSNPNQTSEPSIKQLAQLPFKLLIDPQKLNTNPLLKISWSGDGGQIYIVGPKRRQTARYQLRRRTSASEEMDLSAEFSEVITSIGGLKGVLISPPRSISITELSLWLSVSAPYPIYLIPPKASSL